MQSRIFLYSSLLQCIASDFIHVDFNDTTGLIFNGDIATSNCILVDQNEYSSTHGNNDDPAASLEKIKHETHEWTVSETVETDDFTKSTKIDKEQAGFTHRDTFAAAPQEECPVRLRLTPSRPHTASSVWHKTPLEVLNGFETEFTFQISDQSKQCYEAMDQNFGTQHYKNCIVHGGDGFAFVLHGDSRETAAVGTSGSQLGYGGIANSVAIEFDTWSNPEPADLIWDHVSIHSNGKDPNSANEASRLVVPVRQLLGDGAIHRVQVRYETELNVNYLSAFSVSYNVLQYVRDLSEGRRIGTLLVFIDDGIDNDIPCLAVPLNLAVLLQLEQDVAYVGFTASTGRRWEKHDILSWKYCTEPPCLTRNAVLDHGENSETNPTGVHLPGAYTAVHPFPDTTPWRTS